MAIAARTTVPCARSRNAIYRAAGIFVIATLVCGCVVESASMGAPPRCGIDGDCPPHRYCTEAQICRTDCYTDLDCLGPNVTSQCNTRGRCISSSDAASAGGTVLDADASEGLPADDVGGLFEARAAEASP